MVSDNQLDQYFQWSYVNDNMVIAYTVGLYWNKMSLETSSSLLHQSRSYLRLNTYTPTSDSYNNASLNSIHQYAESGRNNTGFRVPQYLYYSFLMTQFMSHSLQPILHQPYGGVR